MGSKRNWARRNKKSNNWKSIMKKKFVLQIKIFRFSLYPFFTDRKENNIVDPVNNDERNISQANAAQNNNDLGQIDVSSNK